jgi:hypothetical protein
MLTRGAFAVVSGIAKEPNGDAELCPFGQPVRDETLGAIPRRES